MGISHTCSGVDRPAVAPDLSNLDGPVEKWKPNVAVVGSVIKFALGTGRFSTERQTINPSWNTIKSNPSCKTGHQTRLQFTTYIEEWVGRELISPQKIYYRYCCVLNISP